MSVWGAENAVSNAIGKSERQERRDRLKAEGRREAAKAAGRGRRSV